VTGNQCAKVNHTSTVGLLDSEYHVLKGILCATSLSSCGCPAAASRFSLYLSISVETVGHDIALEIFPYPRRQPT